MNQIIVLGKVESINKEKKEFVLAVPRSYSEYNGEMKSDTILCTHFNNINKNMTTYINIEDSIIIKGRLEEKDNKHYIKVESYKVLKRKI